MGLFLDKDLIFKYARMLAFGHKIPKKQQGLAQEVIDGKHTACISNNTPFAVLNYIKYRAQDPHLLGKCPEEADKIAKGIFSQLFGRGKWILVNLEMKDYENASRDSMHEWGDAVQYQCVLKTKIPFAAGNVRDFQNDPGIKLIPVRWLFSLKGERIGKRLKWQPA